MTGYTFAPGVSACLADGRLVILNTRLDRYLMLPDPAEASLRRLLDRAPDTHGDRALRERLCTGGLVLRRAASTDLALCHDRPPACSLIDDGWPRPGGGAVAGAALRVTLAIAGLRLGGLERALRRVSRIGPPGANDAAITTRAAAAFAQLRFGMKALDRCLPLSIALAAAGKRAHGGVRLVLGVQRHPFAAHAWVQEGGTVLNDRLDTVRAFTPILVV